MVWWSLCGETADGNCRLRRIDGFAVYRWPDGSLDLPVGEKCSWWRLDGYDTCESEAEEADPGLQAPLDEETDVDSEEEGHRSDIELSLSDSD